MERKSLQPDIYGEGKDSAGAITTPYFCAQKAAQPRPRQARGAGLAGSPGRRDGWCGTEPAAAGVLTGSLLRSAASPRSSLSSQLLAVSPTAGLHFPAIARCSTSRKAFPP